MNKIDIPIEIYKKYTKWSFFKDFLNFAHIFEIFFNSAPNHFVEPTLLSSTFLA